MEKKNPHAVAMGKLGGRKGGLARAKNLSHEEIQEIGRKGALKRWARQKAKK
jgi:general stress protein YciG